ncbi:MAG: type II secretion system protein [Fimbriimonadaceae bacterium]|nr:type II secretion system protein [Fimbriimonadaceae bacterium]
MNRLRSGLTLIELITVIAIIAILAGLITSAVVWGMHRAQESVCSAHLHSIGVAMDLYASDHEGFYPPYADRPLGIDGKDQAELLAQSIESYKVDKSELYCPLDTVAGRTGMVGTEDIDHRFSSYNQGAAVSYFGFYTVKSSDGIRLSQQSIAAPARTKFFYDDTWYVSGSGKETISGSIHGTWRNTLYFDGHVKSETVNQPLCEWPGQNVDCPL